MMNGAPGVKYLTHIILYVSGIRLLPEELHNKTSNPTHVLPEVEKKLTRLIGGIHVFPTLSGIYRSPPHLLKLYIDYKIK